jgi:hypothetical protein
MPAQNYLIFCLLFFFITVPYAISRTSQVNYNLPYIEQGPDIDGNITEGEWGGAEHLYLENETDPSQNAMVTALII